MNELLGNIVNFIAGPAALFILGGAYVSLVVGERIFAWVKGRYYDDADARCGVALNLTNSFFNLFLGLIFPFIAYVYVWENFRIFDSLPIWLGLVIAFLWHDLMYYVAHFISHRVGLVWALHSVHHASNEFNHSVAARGTILDGLIDVPYHLPAALLGVPPVSYGAVTICKQIFGMWNHASYVGHLGRLENWLCTPMNHKIHHANQPEYIDRNYGQVLLIWDRLFGTHAPLGAEPIPGLVKPIENTNPLKAQITGIAWLAARVRSADRWQDKLAYLWRPPEWSHDGVCRSDCPKYGPNVQLA